MSEILTFKRLRESLTVWVNSVVGVLSLLIVAAHENIALVKDSFSPEVYQYLLFGLAIANVFLRLRTKTGIAMGSAQE